MHFAREQLGQFAADLIGDAIGPGALRHFYTPTATAP